MLSYRPKRVDFVFTNLGKANQFFQQEEKNSMKHKNRGLSAAMKNTVPVIINGASGSIDVSTIPQKDWKHCHGITQAGVEVNSLKLAFIGDSVIIQRPDGFRASFKADDLEVLASQYAEARKTAGKTLKA